MCLQYNFVLRAFSHAHSLEYLHFSQTVLAFGYQRNDYEFERKKLIAKKNTIMTLEVRRPRD